MLYKTKVVGPFVFGLSNEWEGSDNKSVCVSWVHEKNKLNEYAKVFKGIMVRLPLKRYVDLILGVQVPYDKESAYHAKLFTAQAKEAAKYV